MAASPRNGGLNAAAGLALAMGLAGATGPAHAGPITFNTALPVAQDTFSARAQLLHRERDDDLPGAALRDDRFWHLGIRFIF